MRETGRIHATVLIPIYNDWDSLGILLRELDRELSDEYRLHLLLVDDASTHPKPSALIHRSFSAFGSVTCLRLKCNVGHQRAIAIGLSWLVSSRNIAPVIVMDGDGEDKPSDLPQMLRLFQESGGDVAVFAGRTKRSESLLFKVFYRLYRGLHRVMVGLPVRIGNFSVIPFTYVEGLTVSNYLWYHYAATVVRTRMPFVTLKTARGNRYSGVSKMNFVSLVRHGISAIAVQSEVLSIRMLILACGFTMVGLAALAAVLGISAFTSLAIPRWTGLIALLLLLQVLSVAFTFAMQSVSVHGNNGLIPVRDCSVFVRSVQHTEVGAHAWLEDAVSVARPFRVSLPGQMN
jgi:polyisoprenyl-phosphate glycosyltransferase